MNILKKYQRFIRFCIVGGSGAIITFSITWFLTEKFNLWYMVSMAIAVAIATAWNYNFNLLWTFKTASKFTDANYEWEAFYNGNPIQRWWKQSIAKTIWEWIPDPYQYLLDVGCGSSPILTKYIMATGVDTNLAKLEFMRSKVPFVTFQREIDNCKYDNVLCIEVLEHLENPLTMIGMISAHLDVGGKAIFATPDYNKRLWYLAEKFTPYKDDHCTKLNKESLEMFCKSVGLYPIKHRYVAGCDLIEMFEKRE